MVVPPPRWVGMLGNKDKDTRHIETLEMKFLSSVKRYTREDRITNKTIREELRRGTRKRGKLMWKELAQEDFRNWLWIIGQKGKRSFLLIPNYNNLAMLLYLLKPQFNFINLINYTVYCTSVVFPFPVSLVVPNIVLYIRLCADRSFSYHCRFSHSLRV